MVGTSMCRGSRGPEMRSTILRLPTFSIGRGMGREIHTASSAWSKSLMDSGCCRRFSAFISARAMTASCVDGARLSSWVLKTFWFMGNMSPFSIVGVRSKTWTITPRNALEMMQKYSISIVFCQE